MKKQYLFPIITVIVLAVLGTLAVLVFRPNNASTGSSADQATDVGTPNQGGMSGAVREHVPTKIAPIREHVPAKSGGGKAAPLILNGHQIAVLPIEGNGGKEAANYEAVQPSLDTLVARMKWGRIAFNHPSTMKLNEVKTIQLVLSPSDTEAELRKAIIEAGDVRVRPVQWSDKMEADLVSSGFKVTPITSKRQGVATTGGAQWEWQIQAENGGPQTLHLTLDALFKVDGEVTPSRVQTFNDDIVVQVSLPQRVETFVGSNPNLKWIWTSLILPVLAYIWNKRRKQNGAEPAPADAEAHPADAEAHPAGKP